MARWNRGPAEGLVPKILVYPVQQQYCRDASYTGRLKRMIDIVHVNEGSVTFRLTADRLPSALTASGCIKTPFGARAPMQCPNVRSGLEVWKY